MKEGRNTDRKNARMQRGTINKKKGSSAYVDIVQRTGQLYSNFIKRSTKKFVCFHIKVTNGSYSESNSVVKLIQKIYRCPSHHCHLIYLFPKDVIYSVNKSKHLRGLTCP